MNANAMVNLSPKPEDKLLAESAAEDVMAAATTEQADSSDGSDVSAASDTPGTPDNPDAPTSADSVDHNPAPGTPITPSTPSTPATTAAATAPVPEPRASADPDPEAERGGKSKRPRKAAAVRGGRTAGGTKALVVWHQGRVHYADDSVLVIDLDEAASPDMDVHDIVDRLAELREAADSPGRTEAVTALVEIIQEKALN
jgi:hypothetical protein